MKEIPMFRIFAMATTLFLLSVAHVSAQLPACWSANELQFKAGEELFHQDIPEAYIPPPSDPPVVVNEGFNFGAKALRRVDMPNDEKLVSLTFDIGEQPHEISGYQGRIVDYLRKNGIEATMFLGGKWMLTHPVRTRQMIADPLFEVANHGWEHRNLRLLNRQDQLDSIVRAQTAYRTVRQPLENATCSFDGSNQPATAVSTHEMKLYRFPFGACKQSSLELIEEMGMVAVQWDVVSADPWKGQTTARMVKSVLSRTKPGSILIFHANGRGWKTDEAIPLIVSGLKKKGYSFRTVSNLLSVPGAKPVLSNTCYDQKPGDSDRYDDIATKLHARYERYLKKMRK